jgi:hypothetical protein
MIESGQSYAVFPPFGRQTDQLQQHPRPHPPVLPHPTYKCNVPHSRNRHPDSYFHRNNQFLATLPTVRQSDTFHKLQPYLTTILQCPWHIPILSYLMPSSRWTATCLSAQPSLILCPLAPKPPVMIPCAPKETQWKSSTGNPLMHLLAPNSMI